MEGGEGGEGEGREESKGRSKERKDGGDGEVRKGGREGDVDPERDEKWGWRKER